MTLSTRRLALQIEESIEEEVQDGGLAPSVLAVVRAFASLEDYRRAVVAFVGEGFMVNATTDSQGRVWFETQGHSSRLSRVISKDGSSAKDIRVPSFGGSSSEELEGEWWRAVRGERP